MITTQDGYRKKLIERYFDCLEDNGVDLLDFEFDPETGHTDRIIKPQYSIVTSDLDAMAQYLGYRDFNDFAWDRVFEAKDVKREIQIDDIDLSEMECYAN